MSVGFANFEEPIGPVEGPLGVEAGSLIELAGHQMKLPTGSESQELYNLIDDMKRLKSRSWGGEPLKQARSLDSEDQEARRDYLVDETIRAARSSRGSMLPFEVQSIRGGVFDAYNSLGAAILQPFDPETSDWMVRNIAMGEPGRQIAMKMEGYDEDGFGSRRWFNKNLYGSAKSITTALLLGAAAKWTGGSSFGFMSAGFAATEVHSSWVEAIDSGKLTRRQAFDYAWKKGATEAGVMAVFNSLGLAGLEKQWLSKNITKGLVKEFGMGFLAELPEEEITEILHLIHTYHSGMGEQGKNADLWVGDDGEFLSSPAWASMKDTFTQTLFTMGGATGARGITDKSMSVFFDPSRMAFKELEKVAPELHDSLEEKHGNLRKKGARESATFELLGTYIKRLTDKGEMENEVNWWEEISKDEERTASERGVAEAVLAKLDGSDKWNPEASGSVLAGLMGERRAAWLPEATIGLRRAPQEAADRKVEVPKAILAQDPSARIVKPLDTLSTDPELQDEHAELVRVLEGVQELAREARGGREIFFVDAKSGVKGQYTGDGIYVTMPSLQRNMKDGRLDTEGLRAAVAGTFAHEWSHELKRVNENLWQEMYEALAKDTKKYGPLIEAGASKFQEVFDSYAGAKADPYSGLRGEANKKRLDDIKREESLAYVMDKHFISTGLVSKMARRNRTTLESLRDWLKRIRNGMFGDELYLQMVDVFNKVGESYDMEPIPTEPPKQKKGTGRKQPRNTPATAEGEGVDNRRKDLTRGVPEWAEDLVLKLESRGTVVLEKHHASEGSVVVTTKTKAGMVRIWTLTRDGMPKSHRIAKGYKTDDASDFTEDMRSAVDEAVFDAKAADLVSVREEGEYVSPSTEAANKDLDILYEGIRRGYTDPEQGLTVEATDIDEFSKRLAESKKSDEDGPFIPREEADDLDVNKMKDGGLALEVDGKLRLTDWGKRVMSWTGEKDVVGERFSLSPITPETAMQDAHISSFGMENAVALRDNPEKFEGVLEEFSEGLDPASINHPDHPKHEDAVMLLRQYGSAMMMAEEKGDPLSGRISGEMHAAAARFGMEISRQGDGSLVLKAGHGKQILASPSPRFSLERLDERLYPSAVAAKKRSMRKSELRSISNLRRMLEIGEVEGLTDEDVAAMESANSQAEIGLRGSPHEGKENWLIERVWGFDEGDLVVKWVRENRPNALSGVVESVWSDHHIPLIKKVGGEQAGDKLVKFIASQKKALVTGKGAAPRKDNVAWRLAHRVRLAVPSPTEYRQLPESSDRFSLEMHGINLPDEYWSGKSKKHVDQRTRSLVDMVEAQQYLRTAPEVKQRVEDEVKMQIQFGKDPAGETKRLMERGLRGGVFNSEDIVLSELAHKRILSILDRGGKTAEETEALLQQKMWLAMISNEAASEWGRVGAYMRDRVETVRERGLRAIDKALYAPSERLRRRIAVWRHKASSGSDASRMKAKVKLAELRAEWAAEAVRVEAVLESKGWDLTQIDRFLSNREALEAYIYDIKKAKGQVGTVEQILYEIFINNILSGPLTQSVNVASNAAYAIWEYGPKRFTHAIANESLMALGMKAGDPMAPRIGEFKYLFKGTQRAFFDALRHFGRSLMFENESFEMSLGVKASETRAKFEQGRTRHIGGPGSWQRGARGKAEFLAGRAVRALGTTSLTALDSFQKCMNAHAEVVALVYRESKSGVTMPDGSVRVLEGDQIGEYMDAVLNDKSHPIWGMALEKARDTVFQGEPSRFASWVIRGRSTVPAVKWLVPFVLTPDNLLRKGVNYSPLGIASLVHGGYQIVRDGRTDVPMVEQFVNQLAAWTLLLWMCDDDEEPPRITGTVPDQPQEWAGEARSQTIPPMSVRTGQNDDGSWNYVPYGRLEPFSTVLALCADVRSSIKKGTLDFSVKRIGESLVELAKDKTFLKVLGDVGKILKSPTKGGLSLSRGYITAVVPNSYKQVQRARRDYAVDRRTWGSEVVEKDEESTREEEMGILHPSNWEIPTSEWMRMWGRNTIRSTELGIYEDYEKYDARGNKIPTGHYPYGGQQTSFLYNLLVPFKAKNVHEGVGDKVLRVYNEQHPEERLGVAEPDPYWVIDGETRYLKKPEYQEYCRLAGKINDKLVDSEAVDLKNPTKQDVESLWRDNYNRSQRAAQEIMLKREAGLPIDDDLSRIADRIYNNKTKKHLNVLSRKDPTLKDVFTDLGMDDLQAGRNLWKSYSKPERDNAMQELKLKLHREQDVSYEWLQRQGHTTKNLRGRRSELGMGRGWSFSRALNRMRKFQKGGENDGQRNVSPRAKTARRPSRLQAG